MGRLLVNLAAHAQARALPATERFKASLEALGLERFYREAGWPDQCRPLADEEYSYAL